MIDSASVADAGRPAIRRRTLSRSLRGSLKGGEYTWAVAFVVPYVAVFVTFVAYPVVYGLWMGSEISLYRELFADPIYQSTVVNTALYLALADGELHGYAIMKGVAARSEGSVRLGPGTLYGSLKRLLEAGLVEEGDERADPERGDERRRYYQLTPLGLSVARAEARRLEAMVRAARRRKLIGERPA